MDLISTNALGGGIYHPSYFNTYLSSITNAEKNSMVVVLECNHFSSSTITCLDELNRRDLRNRPFKNPGHNPWYKPSLHVHKVSTMYIH